MSEPVRIKITPDSKMMEIPIGKDKEFQSRVLLEVMFDVITSGKTEDEACGYAESIIEWVARKFSEYLKENADGVRLPSPSECLMTSWGVRAVDTRGR